MLQINRPYNLFILAALLILAIAFLCWSESLVIDIFGFTIFVDGNTTLYSLPCLMIAYWIMYKLCWKHLISHPLTWAHIIITIGTVAYFLLTDTLYLKSNATNAVEADLLAQLMINRQRTISVTSVTGILFIIGQLMFVCNLTIGLRRRAR